MINRLGREVDTTSNSGKRLCSTLGFVPFAEQLRMITTQGYRNFISKAFDSFDPKQDVDDLVFDLTREIGFDIADYSELQRYLEHKIFNARRMQAAVAKSDAAVTKPEAAATIASPEPVPPVQDAQVDGEHSPRPERL